MDKKLAVSTAVLILVGLVVMAILTGRADEAAQQEAPNASARFDEASGRCVGGEAADRIRCEDQLAEMEATLKMAVTAQESFSTINNGQYTESISDLETEEGLQIPPGLELTVATGPGPSTA